MIISVMVRMSYIQLCTPIKPPIAVATVIITLIMKLHTERGEDELLINKRF